MEKVIIENKQEFFNCLEDSIFDPEIKDCTFNYFFEYGKIVFQDIIGKNINATNNIISFTNCDFPKGFLFRKTTYHYASKDKFYKLDITFENCTFYGISFIEEIIDVKISFFNCQFMQSVGYEHSKNIADSFNFHNITFKKLVSFWKSEFYTAVAFFQTNFDGNLTFSGAEFYENLLFPYSSFQKKIIFSNVKFIKGFDLSLALNSGEYNFFGIEIKNFASISNDVDSQYDNCLNGCNISNKNKIETFRIIKNQLEKVGNNIEAFKYNSLEKRAYQLQLIAQDKKWYNNQDSLMFSLNNVSNRHKKSWIKGVGFTIKVAVLFYTLSILLSGEFYLSFDDIYETINLNLKAIVVFLNPVHNPNYITEIYNIKSSDLNGWYYALDFLGRIFVEYGIYQTIQAFRKFR